MIGEAKRQAPFAVVGLGWVWIISQLGVLTYGASLLLLFGVIQNFTPGGLEGFPKPPPIAMPIYWTVQHYVLVGSALSALALLGIYWGAQFLRLKHWARAALETAGWTAIALSLLFGLWQSEFWLAPGAGGNHGMVDFAFVRLVYGLFSAAFLAVFPAVFVVLLRSRSVRSAFAPGAQPGKP